MTPVAEARALHHGYGHGPGAVVLADGLDLSIGAGEVVGVCGPSGSGKSTLLRLLAGLERPRRGTVLLAGLPAHARRPGFVMPLFQHPGASIDRRWSVARTVAEPLTASHRAKSSPHERREAVREALGRVGLSHVDLDARPGELSIGQCQRVALARALMAEPALLLADEPTSALDVITAAGIIRLLRDIADGGIASSPSSPTACSARQRPPHASSPVITEVYGNLQRGRTPVWVAQRRLLPPAQVSTPQT